MPFNFNSSRKENSNLRTLISPWEIHNGRGVVFKLGTSVFYWNIFSENIFTALYNLLAEPLLDCPKQHG